MKLKTEQGILKVTCLDYHKGKIYAYRNRKHVGTFKAETTQIIFNEKELQG